MFVHIVLFKFKESSNIAEAKRRLESMAGMIPGLISVEAGIDVVRKAHSWDLVLNTRFQDRAAYESYATDPVHVNIVKWLKPLVNDKATIDYEVS